MCRGTHGFAFHRCKCLSLFSDLCLPPSLSSHHSLCSHATCPPAFALGSAPHEGSRGLSWGPLSRFDCLLLPEQPHPRPMRTRFHFQTRHSFIFDAHLASSQLGRHLHAIASRHLKPVVFDTELTIFMPVSSLDCIQKGGSLPTHRLDTSLSSLSLRPSPGPPLTILSISQIFQFSPPSLPHRGCRDLSQDRFQMNCVGLLLPSLHPSHCNHSVLSRRLVQFMLLPP